MKKNRLTLWGIIFICFFISVNDMIFASCIDVIIAEKIYSDKFKVLKIKSRKGIYIIYAERNDTLFKIVTEKSKLKYSKSKKIRRNKEYYFSLETLFPRYIYKLKCPPPGATGMMATYFGGIYVKLEPENDIWDLFEATNLKGLYLIKELEKSSIELFDKPFE